MILSDHVWWTPRRHFVQLSGVVISGGLSGWSWSEIFWLRELAVVAVEFFLGDRVVEESTEDYCLKIW